MNAQYTMTIGNCMGGFIEFDDSDPLGLDNFMRIKVMIDFDKPLRRGIKIAINSNTSKWVDIKYERLGDFCYNCGKLGHVDRECTMMQGDYDKPNNMVYKCGPWLRASPLKRNRVSKEESDREKIMLNKLKNKEVGNAVSRKDIYPVENEQFDLENVECVKEGSRDHSVSTKQATTGKWRRISRDNTHVNCMANEMQNVVSQNIAKNKKRLPEVFMEDVTKKLKTQSVPMENDEIYEVAGIGDSQPREEPSRSSSGTVEGLATLDQLVLSMSGVGERPNLVFLMETMIDGGILEKIKRRCGFDNGLCFSSDGNSGGLGLWWRGINFSLTSISNHHIMGDILDNNGAVVWRAMAIYGWLEVVNRYKTWDLMSTLKASSNFPCLMSGDFYEIVSLAEKEGGTTRSERAMDGFRDAIDTCRLKDLGYKGSAFTWQRGKDPTTLVRERLDHFLADGDWCNIFSNVEVRHYLVYKYDHALIYLKVNDEIENNTHGKSFKFEAYWLSREDCRVVVADAWKECPTMDAASKLEVFALKLKKWASNTLVTLRSK
ncbi:Protein lin-28-like protein A [Bienertia sinuspersici]